MLEPIFNLVLSSRFEEYRCNKQRLSLTIDNPDDIDECIDYVKGFALRVLLRFISISKVDIDIQEDSFSISSNQTEKLLVYSCIQDKEVILTIYLEELYKVKIEE